MDSIDVYWVGGLRWQYLPRAVWHSTRSRRGRYDPGWRSVLRSTWRARKPWQRRWQAEWHGAPFAVRGWTRAGARRRAARAIAGLAATDAPEWARVTWRRRAALLACRVVGHRLQGGIDVAGWDWCLRCEDAVALPAD